MGLLASTTGIALNNILWATDLSVSSEIALPYVLALARRYDARVYLTNIVPTHSANVFLPKENGDLFEERRRQAEEMVIDLDSSGRLRGVRHLVLIREGEAGETLCRTILDYNIDLIVMVTGRRNGIKKSLLDSVTEEVVRRTSCGVLSIGAKCSGDIAQDYAFRNIVCATDLSPYSRGASDYAIALAREYQARVTLVHVPENIIAQTEDCKAVLIEALRRRLEELVPDGSEERCELNFVVDFGTPARRIIKVADEQRADLIVLGIRRNDDAVECSPGFTAFPVISNASCPVLSVPGFLSDLAVSNEVGGNPESSQLAAD